MGLKGRGLLPLSHPPLLPTIGSSHTTALPPPPTGISHAAAFLPVPWLHWCNLRCRSLAPPTATAQVTLPLLPHHFPACHQCKSCCHSPATGQVELLLTHPPAPTGASHVITLLLLPCLPAVGISRTTTHPPLPPTAGGSLCHHFPTRCPPAGQSQLLWWSTGSGAATGEGKGLRG